MACAVYRQKYGEWRRLAAHLELRTPDHVDITVGGRGVVKYSQVDHGRIDDAMMRLAEKWLDLKIGPDLER